MSDLRTAVAPGGDDGSEVAGRHLTGCSGIGRDLLHDERLARLVVEEQHVRGATVVVPLSTDVDVVVAVVVELVQRDAAAEAGIFHHLITLPTYHTAALSTDNLAKDYFGDDGMLAYVANVQRQEIRQSLACVKHQDMSGSNIGDDHKEYYAGENALKAGGAKNTSNQFNDI